MIKTENFDAAEVTLEKKNLIEASAGTGKTYSIAILTLRLLLEKQPGKDQPISIEEMLMVTFTTNAVAELETRIRQFVRDAYNISTDQYQGNDETIIRIVEQSMHPKSNGKEKTQQLLKHALLMLDETYILTIHSFCQRILTDFAFDTGQLFGAKAITGSDYSNLMERTVREWWRDHILTMDYQLYSLLHEAHVQMDEVKKITELSLSGKKWWVSELYANELTPEGKEQFLKTIKTNYDDLKLSIEKECIDYLEKHKDRLKEKALANGHVKKWDPVLFDDSHLLFVKIFSDWGKQNVKKVYSDIADKIDKILETEEGRKAEIKKYLQKIYQHAANAIIKQIDHYKEKYSLIFFNDMINRLAEAVASNESLSQALSKQFKAVFIDEFQDTDRAQYDIFSGLFSTDTILFYIGDPKQSIYGFRSADINTYFKAKHEGVDRILQMNTNYRSTAGIVHSLNQFFLPLPDFDTFHMKGTKDVMDYIPVQTPQNHDVGLLLKDGQQVDPLSLIMHQKKEELPDAVSYVVVELLKENYTIQKNGEQRKVKPSDIGILVRNKWQGEDVKRKLKRFGIPAVSINEAKILESNEAKEMSYVLEAIYTVKTKNINKALLSNMTGLSMSDIELLDETVMLEKFKYYHDIWQNEREGVYVMLMKFLADFNVKTYLLNTEVENGDRILSNTLQLIELLHAIQNRKQYSPTELIQWLQKGINGSKTEGDDYEQRIESDEASVKIVTIHKSKGLEYNIVIAPYLDTDNSIPNKISMATFRSEEDGSYYFINKQNIPDECEAWRVLQSEQENRRLLYVALTRAKYKCYIHHVANDESTTLKAFMDAIAIKEKEEGSILFEYKTPDIVKQGEFYYNNGEKKFPIIYQTTDRFELERSHWRKMSYSGLTPEHSSSGIKGTVIQPVDSYDRFIFKELKKGSNTGNVLHSLFENIDFTQPAQWSVPMKRFAEGLGMETDQPAIDKIQCMLNHVLNMPIETGEGQMKLSAVKRQQKINELEFDFPVNAVKQDIMARLSPDDTPWQIKKVEELDGMMNGKIDLFFEYGGKFFILDWKSNHLGDSLSDYAKENLLYAMNENNYHLQYHIYTVAACKFLASRKPDFDYDQDFGGVIYMFIRGIRNDQSTGVYFHKPSKDLLQKMIDLM